jgi:hypothetical protein
MKTLHSAGDDICKVGFEDQPWGHVLWYDTLGESDRQFKL